MKKIEINIKLKKNIFISLKRCEKIGPFEQKGFIHTIGIRQISSKLRSRKKDSKNG